MDHRYKLEKKIKLLEENIREKKFLKQDLKVLPEMGKKMDKLAYIKMKNFCSQVHI